MVNCRFAALFVLLVCLVQPATVAGETSTKITSSADQRLVQRRLTEAERAVQAQIVAMAAMRRAQAEMRRAQAEADQRSSQHRHQHARRIVATELQSILLGSVVRYLDTGQWRFDRGEPFSARILSQRVGLADSVVVAVIETSDRLLFGGGSVRIFLSWNSNQVVGVRVQAISFQMHEGR